MMIPRMYGAILHSLLSFPFPVLCLSPSANEKLEIFEENELRECTRSFIDLYVRLAQIYDLQTEKQQKEQETKISIATPTNHTPRATTPTPTPTHSSTQKETQKQIHTHPHTH